MHAYKLYKALGDGAVDSTDRYIFKPRKFRKCSPKNNIYIPVNNKCDFFTAPPSQNYLSQTGYSIWISARMKLQKTINRSQN